MTHGLPTPTTLHARPIHNLQHSIDALGRRDGALEVGRVSGELGEHGGLHLPLGGGELQAGLRRVNHARRHAQEQDALGRAERGVVLGDEGVERSFRHGVGRRRCHAVLVDQRDVRHARGQEDDLFGLAGADQREECRGGVERAEDVDVE